MKITTKNINDIFPYENNPRINDNAISKVAESIKAYGWQQPIVVDKNGVIIVGHTRYKAAKLLGLIEIPCVVADNLSEKEAKAYRIADNKTSDFSIWDNRLLLEELEDLDDLFTGFEINDMSDAEVLNEKDDSLITEDDFKMMYEVVFRSEDKEKIAKIKEIWDSMSDEK